MARPGTELVVHAGQQRGRPADEQSHRPAHRAVEAGLGEQPCVEGGHAHHHRAARQGAQHGVGLELREEHHRRASDEGAVGGDEQPVGVEDGQRVQQHVVAREPPQPGQREAVGRQVAVAQHRPLRLARGAAGVQHGGQVVGPAGVVLELGGEPRRSDHQIVEFGVVQHQAGLGVGHQLGHLGGRVARVHRQQRHPRANARQVHQQRVDPLLHLHRQSVAGLQALCPQRMRHLRRPPCRVAVGEQHGAVGVEQERPLVVGPHRGDDVEQRGTGPRAVGVGRHQCAPHDSRWIIPPAGRRWAGLKSSPV